MRIQSHTYHTPALRQINQERQSLLARLSKDEQALAQNTAKRISEESKISLQMGETPAKSNPNEPDYGSKDPLKKAKDELKKEKKEKEKSSALKYQQMDTRVRAHEAAHLAAAGSQASGGASFSYTRGPDGKLYASAGEVAVALKKGKTPSETIQNAATVIAAALAPADPSPQDLKIASNAARMQAIARSELASDKTEQKTADFKAQKNDKTNEESKSGLRPLDERALKEYTKNDSYKASKQSLDALYV